MAIPNFISGIFGITEPAIYGMLLPLKNHLLSAVSQEELVVLSMDISILENLSWVVWEFSNCLI